MTTREKDTTHLTALIADLRARAARMTGKEAAELESAARYYEARLAR